MGMPGSLEKLKDKEKVSVLESRIKFQNETIESQKTQITEYKTEIAQLKEQIDKFSTSIQNQTDIIAEQQITLKDQESTILKQQISISELQKELIGLQKKIDAANTKLSRMDEIIHEKTNELRTKNVNLKNKLIEKEKDFNKKVETLEDTIKKLRNRISPLEKKEKQLEDLTDKISASNSSSLEKRVLDLKKVQQEANLDISNLEKELQNTKEKMENEIRVREVKIKEYERLIKKQVTSIPISLNVILDKEGASRSIANIFTRTKSNVMIFVPDVSVLDSLDFENLRPIIRVQLAVPVQKNRKLIDKLKMKPNFEIRNYTENIIWGIIRDNEELLIAPINEREEPTGLIMKGDTQINMFGNIIRSAWTRLKRI